MFRHLLPVAVCLCAGFVGAETLQVPGLTGPPTSAAPVSDCKNIVGDQSNCVRVLACVGEAGLYFDGRAQGWDQGIVTGTTNLGTACVGHWDSNGPWGTGRARMLCSDQLTLQVIYYSQDNLTGTVIGSGKDSLGRRIRVWSGENVLKFLTGPAGRPELPCGDDPIPIS